MGWRNCGGCGRSYRTDRGCLDPACKNPAPATDPPTGPFGNPLPSGLKAPVAPSGVPTGVKSPISLPANPTLTKPSPSTATSTAKTPPTHFGPLKAPSSSASPTQAKPSATTQPVIATTTTKQEADVLSWVNDPVPTSTIPSPTGIVAKAESFTMTVYRGEKSEWWPPPELRLAAGMTLRQPWEHTTMAELWKALQKDMNDNGGGTPGGYAQYLRATGRVYALATARTRGGAFEGFNYEIEIPNVRTFLWGPKFSLGPPANFRQVGKQSIEKNVNGKVTIEITDRVSADYIVLNADNIEASTILGFGHKTGTYEVTFFHHLPIGMLKACNNRPISSFRILTPEAVTKLSDAQKENQWAKDLLKFAHIGLHAKK